MSNGTSEQQRLLDDELRRGRLRVARGNFESELQELREPLNEAGVELLPENPTRRCVSGGITRVWSWLWGRDRHLMRLLRCDRGGVLHSGGLDLNLLTSFAEEDLSLTIGSSVLASAVGVFDVLSFVSTGVTSIVRFENSSGGTIIDILPTGGGQGFSAALCAQYGLFHCRAHNVRVINLDGPGGTGHLIKLRYQ